MSQSLFFSLSLFLCDTERFTHPTHTHTHTYIHTLLVSHCLLVEYWKDCELVEKRKRFPGSCFLSFFFVQCVCVRVCGVCRHTADACARVYAYVCQFCVRMFSSCLSLREKGRSCAGPVAVNPGHVFALFVSLFACGSFHVVLVHWSNVSAPVLSLVCVNARCVAVCLCCCSPVAHTLLPPHPHPPTRARAGELQALADDAAHQPLHHLQAAHPRKDHGLRVLPRRYEGQQRWASITPKASQCTPPAQILHPHLTTSHIPLAAHPGRQPHAQRARGGLCQALWRLQGCVGPGRESSAQPRVAGQGPPLSLRLRPQRSSGPLALPARRPSSSC